MTTINDIERKCSVCGHTSLHPVIMSTNTWTYPDLDLRPSEMQRSTMFAWVMECPNCGYVSANIEKKIDISEDYLKSEEYMTCEGHEFESELAKKFYKNYLLSDDEESKFHNLLHCAWACDDANDELAVEMRKLAIDPLNHIIEEAGEEKDDYLLMKADLLRRSLQFGEVISQYSSMTFDREILNQITTFQVIKAKAEDSECYTIGDVLKDE